MHALAFLSKRALHHTLEGHINAVRAAKKIPVPVVMTREEVAARGAPTAAGQVAL